MEQVLRLGGNGLCYLSHLSGLQTRIPARNRLVWCGDEKEQLEHFLLPLEKETLTYPDLPL